MRQHHPSLKIGVSGVRGIAGQSLTPEIVASFSAAFGTYCGREAIAVGTDTRPSRVMVTPAVMAGLLSVGCTPVRLGVVPTPTLQFHVARHAMGGGICITASHNPLEWNALKFCTSAGQALRPYEFAELLDLYHQGVFPRVGSEEIQEIGEDTSAISEHIRAVSAFADRGAIGKRRFRIVVDCCNAAASKMTPEFLRNLNCEVHEIHTNPDEPFPRSPEPTGDHLSALGAAVCEKGADLGFAQDADGDRLAIVDERGRPAGEDFTVAVAVEQSLRRRSGPVVISVATSRMVEDVARSHGSEVFRCRVGEAHVLEKMDETGASIGGEGNGGVIVPELNRCRDSFAAMALALEYLAARQIPLSRVLGEFSRYTIVHTSVPCRSGEAAAFVRLMQRVHHDATLDLTDGVKVIGPESWLLIRVSNTEPLLRLTAEAGDEAAARRRIDSALGYFR